MTNLGFMRSQPITPDPRRLGFFEVTYTPGKTGVPGSGVSVFCLEAQGFQACKEAFDKLGLGEYRWVREITEEKFRDWQDIYLADGVGLYD